MGNLLVDSRHFLCHLRHILELKFSPHKLLLVNACAAILESALVCVWIIHLQFFPRVDTVCAHVCAHTSLSSETLPTGFLHKVTTAIVSLGSCVFCADKIAFHSSSTMPECNGTSVRPSYFSKI